MCEGSNWSIVLFTSDKSPVLHYADWVVAFIPALSTAHATCMLHACRGCSVSDSPSRCGRARFILTASNSGLHSNFWATVRKHRPGMALKQHRLAWPKGLVPRSSQQLLPVHNLVNISASAVFYETDKNQLFLFEPHYFQWSTKELFRDLTSWDQSRCD